MNRCTLAWMMSLGCVALGASIATAAPAPPASQSLLRALLRPGGALDRATIDCDVLRRLSPEPLTPRKIEARARRAEQDLIHRGETPAQARQMADAVRQISVRRTQGWVSHGRAVYHYDAQASSVDAFREREHDGPLPLSLAIFLRRPQAMKAFASSAWEVTGLEPDGTYVVRGPDPRGLGEMTLWVDPLHDFWPLRSEVRNGDTVAEVCSATGFRKWPGGKWFPATIVRTWFARNASGDPVPREVETYAVRAARFNEASGPVPAPPPVESSTEAVSPRWGLAGLVLVASGAWWVRRRRWPAFVAPRGPSLRGFSLVEVLVVIAILTALMALLFPVFAHAREKARLTACASNLAQIGKALHMYCQDWNGYVPPYEQDSRDHDALPIANRNLLNALAPYTHNTAVWRCPSDPLAGQDTFGPYAYHKWSSYVFHGVPEGESPFLVDSPRGWPGHGASEVVFAQDDSAYLTIYVFPEGDRYVNLEWGIGNHESGRNRLFFDGHVKFWPQPKLPPLSSRKTLLP